MYKYAIIGGIEKGECFVSAKHSQHNRKGFVMSDSNDTPNTVMIQLTKGYSTIIDECDSDLTTAHKWNYGSGYAKRTGWYNGKKVNQLLHRIILSRIIGRELAANEYTDHINCDKLDNRRSNLRLATRAENCRNRPLGKTKSGYKGVVKAKSKNGWEAQIKYQGRQMFLGTYQNPEDAHKAYCEKAKELFGDFARFK